MGKYKAARSLDVTTLEPTDEDREFALEAMNEDMIRQQSMIDTGTWNPEEEDDDE